jgi:hypothetical protein
MARNCQKNKYHGLPTEITDWQFFHNKIRYDDCSGFFKETLNNKLLYITLSVPL